MCQCVQVINFVWLLYQFFPNYPCNDQSFIYYRRRPLKAFLLVPGVALLTATCVIFAWYLFPLNIFPRKLLLTIFDFGLFPWGTLIWTSWAPLHFIFLFSSYVSLVSYKTYRLAWAVRCGTIIPWRCCPIKFSLLTLYYRTMSITGFLCALVDADLLSRGWFI